MFACHDHEFGGVRWLSRSETPADRQQKVMARIWLGSAVALVMGYAYYFGYFPGGDWVLEGDEDDDEL